MNMILLQELLTEEAVKHLISNALEASPLNALGYGIALAFSIIINVVCFYVIIKLYKDKKGMDAINEKYSADMLKAIIEMKIRLDDTRTLKEEILRVIREENTHK